MYRSKILSFKLLAIFVGIPLLLIVGLFVWKQTDQGEKMWNRLESKIGLGGDYSEDANLGKKEVHKFASTVIAAHNTLYTVKTNRQYEGVVKTVYHEPKKHEKEAQNIYKVSLKHKIGRSIVSQMDKGKIINQSRQGITYETNLERTLWYGDGRTFVENSRVSFTFARDQKDGLYKIINWETVSSKTKEKKVPK